MVKWILVMHLVFGETFFVNEFMRKTQVMKTQLCPVYWFIFWKKINSSSRNWGKSSPCSEAMAQQQDVQVQWMTSLNKWVRGWFSELAFWSPIPSQQISPGITSPKQAVSCVRGRQSAIKIRKVKSSAGFEINMDFYVNEKQAGECKIHMDFWHKC